MQDDEWVTGQITLRIQGNPVEMEFKVPAKPVKPRRMLPIFQEMSNSFVDLGVQITNARGNQVSCKAGCGACCRQAVPLSELEAYQIAEYVEQLEEPRKSEIKKRFADGADRFHRIGWFERMKNCLQMAQTAPRETVEKEMIETTLEYFHEGVPCPFLENESCSIHPIRPLVCREYLVISPAENCSSLSPQTVKKVDLLVKPSKTVREMTQTSGSAEMSFVPMIRALEFAAECPENFPEKTGDQWTREFFESLAKTEIPEEGIKPKQSKVENLKVE